MELRQASDATLSSFLRAQPPHSGWFLQTPSWAAFLRSQGDVVEQWELRANDNLVGVCMVQEHKLPGGGRYLYLPAGPAVGQPAFLHEAMESIAQHYRANAWFIRMEPRVEVSQPLARGWVQAGDVQPRATLWWDLTPAPEQLLARMHEKTRYNIRLSERKGLEWRLGGAELLDDFLEVLAHTAERDKFTPHQNAHYRNLVDMFGSLPLPQSELAVRLAAVYQNNRPLAVNLMVFCNRVVTYLHGASTSNSRNVMAPYLLHWRTAQEAKRLGYTHYDWWGITPAQGPAVASWAGFTRFKAGFGGEHLEFSGTFDFPYSMLRYRWYRTGRRVKQLLKR